MSIEKSEKADQAHYSICSHMELFFSLHENIQLRTTETGIRPKDKFGSDVFHRGELICLNTYIIR